MQTRWEGTLLLWNSWLLHICLIVALVVPWWTAMWCGEHGDRLCLINLLHQLDDRTGRFLRLIMKQYIPSLILGTTSNVHSRRLLVPAGIVIGHRSCELLHSTLDVMGCGRCLCHRFTDFLADRCITGLQVDHWDKVIMIIRLTHILLECRIDWRGIFHRRYVLQLLVPLPFKWGSLIHKLLASLSLNQLLLLVQYRLMLSCSSGLAVGQGT